MIDDIEKNLKQKYECGLDKLTGSALIYMPIEDNTDFCLYSLLNVPTAYDFDYLISCAPIKQVLSRYKNKKTNIIRLPNITLKLSKNRLLNPRPTKKQKLIATKYVLFTFVDYIEAYNLNRTRERKIKKRESKGETSLEDLLEFFEIEQ